MTNTQMDLCRTCMSKVTESESSLIFSSIKIDESTFRIDELLLNCASIMILPEDKLPDIICILCIEQLKSAFKFKEQCKEVDVEFRKTLEDINKNSIYVEAMSRKDVKEESDLKLIDEFDSDDVFEESYTHTTVFVDCGADRKPTLGSDLEEPVVLKKENNSESHLTISDTPEKEKKPKLFKFDCDKSDKTDKPKHFENKSENTETKTKISDHSCSICNRNFKKSSHLNRHLGIHSNEKPFMCNICQKSFRRKDALNVHEKTHKPETFYECKICFKKFLNMNLLQSHSVLHSTNKPFSCQMCSKRFKSKSQLLKHGEVHEGQQSFQCDICKKTFIHKNDLVVHLRGHKGELPFICKHCGKGFTASSYLTMHERYHTGDKPYSCNICQQSFVRSHHLKEHLRRHTGEKPYKCKYCNASFSAGSTYRGHMKRLGQCVKKSTKTSKKRYNQTKRLNNIC